ncbi:MAG: ABC transporter substrate-binding protein [Deltaproteobacteria bacterium]|nr:ABC transporter substrate-binding protein [Deltaproteobacteria bacterium]
MNFIIKTVLFLYLALSFCGCKKEESPFFKNVSKDSPAKLSPVTFTDALNRRITLKHKAKRIASLSTGVTESLFAIGCGDNVVLRDKWAEYPKEVIELPAVDSYNISIENIASYNPDLVILYFDDDRFSKDFKKIGIDVAFFNPLNYQDVADDILTLGKICGKSENAEKIAFNMLKIKADIEKKTAAKTPKTVYVEVDSTDIARPWTAGETSMVGELVKICGGDNIFKDAKKSYQQVNLESIIMRDPFCIVLADVIDGNGRDSVHKLKTKPGIRNINAVLNDRIIYDIDKDVLTLTGPRLAKGLESLYNALWINGNCKTR